MSENKPDDPFKTQLRPFDSTEIQGDPGADKSIDPANLETVESRVPPQSSSKKMLGSLGDYELLEEIARGGMGVVYKARHSKLNRIVALKMILGGTLADDVDVTRFKVEAESAASLDHWGIVPIYEIGELEGQHYFSMGFIDGPSLREKLADGPMSNLDSAELCLKLVEAIQYAHSKGVIHRDLKPANVILDRAGNPKVTDFGLAKKTDSDSDLTRTGAILGTPSYMSPEQALGAGHKVGASSDVYSIGALLYCLLTGRPPFQSANAVDTIRSVIEDEPVPLRVLDPSIDKDLETICLKCLSKSPEDRYCSASELALDLGRYLDSEPISATTVNFFEKFGRTLKKNQIDSGFENWGSSLLFFAAIEFFTHIGLFCLVISQSPLWALMSMQVLQFVFMGVVIFVYGTRYGFRLRNQGQKQLAIIWGTFAYSCSFAGAACHYLIGNEIFAHYSQYPFWLAISGFAFISTGTIYWGWYYVSGLLFFAAGILAIFVPFTGPLTFGTLWALTLIQTGLRLQKSKLQ